MVNLHVIFTFDDWFVYQDALQLR